MPPKQMPTKYKHIHSHSHIVSKCKLTATQESLPRSPHPLNPPLPPLPPSTNNLNIPPNPPCHNLPLFDHIRSLPSPIAARAHPTPYNPTKPTQKIPRPPQHRSKHRSTALCSKSKAKRHRSRRRIIS